MNFWLNINQINYSSKMDVFVLNANKLYKGDQIIKGISLKFSVQYVIPTLFEFLDHITFCKVVLNVLKVNMEYSVYSMHFNFYFK